jgi:hypothetical protein
LCGPFDKVASNSGSLFILYRISFGSLLMKSLPFLADRIRHFTPRERQRVT